MNASIFKKHHLYLAPIFVALFAFFLPISHTLKSVFILSSVLVILCTPQHHELLKYSFQSLWGREALLLFAFITIAVLWSDAPLAMGLDLVEKYSKLLFLPILAVVFVRPYVRDWVINSYLAGVLVTCVYSLYQVYAVPDIYDPGQVFYNHIITAFIIAWGAYLAALMAYRYKGKLSILYAILFLLSTYQLFFINNAKTGYVIYALLMGLFLIQKAPPKKIVLGLFLLAGAIAILYQASSHFNQGMNRLLTDIRMYQQNQKDTSLGFRLQFHEYAASLWKTHPLMGIGTSGFKYSYAKDKPIPTWGPQLNEPHSQYWMILVEQGVIGLVLFVFFLLSLFVSSFKLNTTRPILSGILIAFTLTCFTDTILCYSIIGYLLVLMAALSLGEAIEKHYDV